MTVHLLAKLHELGYEFTYGSAHVVDGRGHSKNTLHKDKLALDINLFRDEVYLTETDDHLPLGEYWESLGGSWGGRFKAKDGNHYSLKYQGRR